MFVSGNFCAKFEDAAVLPNSCTRTQSTFTIALLSSFMNDENEHAEAELPTELNRLVSLIDEKPEAFASGDKDIQDAALAAAKYIFDLSELFRLR